MHDIPSLKNWEGSKEASREKLLAHFQSLLDLETVDAAPAQPKVPSDRLLALLRQGACAHC